MVNQKLAEINSKQDEIIQKLSIKVNQMENRIKQLEEINEKQKQINTFLLAFFTDCHLNAGTKISDQVMQSLFKNLSSWSDITSLTEATVKDQGIKYAHKQVDAKTSNNNNNGLSFGTAPQQSQKSKK